MSPTFLRNFDERIASHVLYALMRFMHELEQFVHHRLQEFPMGFEEARVLTNNVHDVGRDNSLVILSSFHLHKAEELFDDGHKEAFFRLFVCESSSARFLGNELIESNF